MRTNIEIDDQLLAEAMIASGSRTKKDAVHRALDLLVRLARQRKIGELRGKLPWDGDLDAMRRDR